METEKKREIDVDDLTRFKGQPWSAFIKTFDMNALLGNVHLDTLVFNCFDHSFV